MADRYRLPLQENILALMAHSDDHGKIVARLVDIELFEGDYQIIAERLLRYWQQYKQAPKAAHTGDLFDDILGAGDRRAKHFEGILYGLLQLDDAAINAKYVIDDVTVFTRKQMLTEAIYRSAQALQGNKNEEESIEEVEVIISDILRARNWEFSAGARLDEITSLVDYVQNSSREFVTGVGILDRRGVVPQRGAVMLMIGGKGRGKTWFLTNVGKANVRRDKKVLHVSLENSEEEQKMRYWQALFSVPRSNFDEVEVARLDFDDRRHHRRKREGESDDDEVDDDRRERKVIGTYSEIMPVTFNFASEQLSVELATRLEMMGSMPDNLIVKRFPNRSLTPQILRAYLDSLEQVENWVPDVMILDYLKLMKIDPRNPRLSIGQNMEELRAICVERNIAGVTADQLNRPGYKAKQGHSTDIAEDWSEVHTADSVVVHSATDAEFGLGLGRLWVEHCRFARDKWGAIITQNYTTGQFALESALLPQNYYSDIIKELPQAEGQSHDEDEGDER